jgi:tetratricopeptide (TPR) repeat protein
MKKSRKIILYGLAVVVILAGIGLAIPRVRTSLNFRVSQLYSEIKYALFPPEKSVFTPGQGGVDSVSTAVQATLQAMVTPSATEKPSTPQPTPTITSTPAPLPSRVYLKGVRPEQQRFNNCGPATLSMNLSFYNWVGNSNPDAEIPQDHIAPYLKPNPDDKNVMPYEMQTYVQENTEFSALVRMGGDLHTLKSLLAAGFPVMVEKGIEGVNFEGWMGHYNLVIGYDDAREVFFTQDSYNLLDVGDNWQNSTGFEVPYTTMSSNWRAFNNVFLVVYPQDKANDVLNSLGALADETNAYRVAYDRALQETKKLTDPRDVYFAWFNAGTSQVYLNDYTGAALAYDTAFGMYPLIPEKSRPYRIVWYQTGPYFAYYYTQRYQDVIALADETIKNVAKPGLEESFYWRALAKLSLGDQAGAVKDLRESLVWHEGFTPSVNQLTTLGLTP